MLTLGAIAIISELTTFGAGCVAFAWRLMRKLSTIDELPGKVDNVTHQLDGIRQNAEQWRTASDQWHREHMEYFHPVNAREQRVRGRT